MQLQLSLSDPDTIPATDPMMDDYKAYPSPRKCIYFQTTNEYKFPDGWGRKPIETTVIGETSDQYIEKIITTELGYYVGEKVINVKSQIP
jgi:hypothetical protein